MRLLIEAPTWLGDAVMASGAVDKLIDGFEPDEVILFGSRAAVEVLGENPKISETVVDETRKGNRLFNVLKISGELKSDIGVSFRTHFFSKLLMFLSAKKHYINRPFKGHQVEKYNKFADFVLKKNLPVYSPRLYFKPKRFERPTLGINPGATYGSAKRWYPEEFAKVANALACEYDIVIFGGPGEEDIAADIEKKLTITNYKNLCGKLSLKELCEHIGGLSLFITNDSGPMHIAAAFKVPVVAVFGPTRYDETSPYGTKYKIVTKNVECAPCMKRECPLKHHECMRLIKAEDVVNAAKDLM
ncbi:lipopolysaccharide heptosyltransferase II [Nautilia sp.]